VPSSREPLADRVDHGIRGVARCGVIAPHLAQALIERCAGRDDDERIDRLEQAQELRTPDASRASPDGRAPRAQLRTAPELGRAASRERGDERRLADGRPSVARGAPPPRTARTPGRGSIAGALGQGSKPGEPEPPTT
jgi:hypothetical protein